MIIIFLIFSSLFVKYEIWTEATFIKVNDNEGYLIFENNEIFQNWINKNYTYIKCIENNNIFNIEIFEENMSIDDCLIIYFTDENNFLAEEMSKLSVFIEYQPWIKHIFSNLFF